MDKSKMTIGNLFIGMSGSELAQAFDEGRVTVNGKVVTDDMVIAKGDEVLIQSKSKKKTRR